ncbi:hypothetical protein TNCV_4080551 [Trichonephila clavipes]|nr:hypothetical protein TNCV_4080551 [Trichonephila clavipes]
MPENINGQTGFLASFPIVWYRRRVLHLADPAQRLLTTVPVICNHGHETRMTPKLVTYSPDHPATPQGGRLRSQQI